MVSRLKEMNPVFLHQIDQTMFLRDAPGPNARTQSLQRLGFTFPAKRIPHYRLDQTKDPQGYLAVLFNPINKIIPKVRFKDRESHGASR